MSDIIDRAQKAEELNLKAAFDAHASAMQDMQQADKDGWPICLDCGERIPKARLSANPRAARCIECQGWHEKEAGR